MDPRHLFVDQRLTGTCVYCGAEPDTHDHVPPKVLLDEPFPPELPVVAACANCNSSFSLDEQYFACLLDCVLMGTDKPSRVQRSKIKRILKENPRLNARIAACQKRDDAGRLNWEPEIDRVQNVVVKLARGHAAYQLYPKLEEPVKVSFAPLSVLTEPERETFENVPLHKVDLLPELGTRAFRHTFLVTKPGTSQPPVLLAEKWTVVQPSRYRYVVEPDGLMVKMVLSEYLACLVAWE